MSLRYTAFSFLLFSAWAFSASTVFAEKNPFADLDFETDLDPPPPRLLLIVEWIEVAKADWLAWVGNSENSIEGQDLRTYVQTLIEQKSASTFDLSIMPITSGSRGKIQSTDFYLYPSEYGSTAEMASTGDLAVPIGVAAFECRNLGWTTEVDLHYILSESSATMNYATEHVENAGLSIAGRDENEVKTPIFSTSRLNGATKLLPNKPTFLGALSREKAPNKTMLVFARYDRHQLEKNHIATNEEDER